METARSRIRKALADERPADRLPMLEWASWWNLTVERWQSEGLPCNLGSVEIKRYFGLDADYQFWPGIVLPEAEIAAHSAKIGSDDDYDKLLPYLYPEVPIYYDSSLQAWNAERDPEEAILWMTLNGFFWWPRILFGIEPHLYAFYDHPDLMHRINRDLTEFNLRVIDDFCSRVRTPDFMTFAEDMSYNHGPMISRELFDEFMAPYYRQVIPKLTERGIVPLIDSDGGIEPLIPWFESVGIQGILPLERMAGVDVNRIRSNHPNWKMIGGFDKTVMKLGEDVMRQEFERLLPAMRGGSYIPSVDHQTPPDVSIDNYRIYLRLLREYAETAVRQ